MCEKILGFPSPHWKTPQKHMSSLPSVKRDALYLELAGHPTGSVSLKSPFVSHESYGWWFRNPKQPPGMVLKPCKQWDKLPFPQLVSFAGFLVAIKSISPFSSLLSSSKVEIHEPKFHTRSLGHLGIRLKRHTFAESPDLHKNLPDFHDKHAPKFFV